MKKTIHPKANLALFILLLMILTACQPTETPPQNPDAVLLTVSIPPQAYFVKQIGGSLVEINIMVAPGEEAHTYEPTPEQMKALNDSWAFFSIGIEYENTWIPRFQEINPDLKIINSAAGIERIPIAEHTHDAHKDHETEEDHHNEEHQEEAGMDPHVWLSPNNGKIIAGNILDALITLAPEHETTFQANHDQLVERINALDDQIRTTLSGFENRTFMVFHPAWGYFADAYDLSQIPVQVEGQDPSPSEMADLIETAHAEGIRLIFIQPTFSAADAKAIAAEINAEIAVVDPLAQDWLANLESAAKAFAAALAD